MQDTGGIRAQDHAALKRAAERYAATLDLTPSPTRRSTLEAPSDVPQTASPVTRDAATVSSPDTDATSPARTTVPASPVEGRVRGTGPAAARAPESSGTAVSLVRDGVQGSDATAGVSSTEVGAQLTPHARAQPGNSEAVLQGLDAAAQLRAKPSEVPGQLPVSDKLEGSPSHSAQRNEQEPAEGSGAVSSSAAAEAQPANGMLPAPDAASPSPSRLAEAAAVVKSTTLNMRKLSASEHPSWLCLRQSKC